MGLLGSGIGRTISRALTDSADQTFHFGMTEFPDVAQNTGVVGLLNRLNLSSTKTSSPKPPTAAESAAALRRTESLLSLAFNLAPSYYPAYTVYFLFLTERPRTGHSHATESVGTAQPAAWSQKDTGVRLKKAMEITKTALQSYRLSDPEQSVAAALATYNEYMLAGFMSHNISRKQMAALSQKTSDEMSLLLENARENVRREEWAGTWDYRSEARREDYATLFKFTQKIQETLDSTAKRLAKEEE